jgi:hypothetical protein
MLRIKLGAVSATKARTAICVRYDQTERWQQ